MAYSAVPTVATGDLWTASNHNTYIRDNFAAGVPDIFTTKGDIAVASGPDAASRIGVGANNNVLMADSAQTNGIKWAPISMPAGKCWRSSNQTIANNTYTVITFTNEEFDTGNFINLGTYNSRITIPENGYFLIIGHIEFALYNGTKYIRLKKNGSSNLMERTLVYPESLLAAQVTTLYQLAASDYIELETYQGSGSNMDVVEASLSIVRIAKI